MPVEPDFFLPYEAPLDQPGITLTGGSAGTNEILAIEVAEQLTRLWAELRRGYRFHSRLYFTSSGTFNLSDTPGLRAVKAIVVGGGGGGGGCDASDATRVAGGTGGAAGSEAHVFVEATALGTSVAVTVGAGGQGIVDSDGQDGQASSFGGFAVANGGTGGVRISARRTTGYNSMSNVLAGGVGDLVIHGEAGFPFFWMGSELKCLGGRGGNTAWGTGGGETAVAIGDGRDAVGPGGAGGGARSQASTPARRGGHGHAGIVIVDTYV